MVDKIQVDITDTVADTLFIPLYMRNLESRLDDGLIRDRKAMELVDRIDYDFAKYGDSRKSQVGTSIRIRQFDREVARFIKENDDPVVINIGAGLDTRFQRVYEGKGTFYDLDLPEVISFRKRLLPESENNVYLESSMFDVDWMEEIKSRHPESPFILVAEGVFMYFSEKQIRELVVQLVDCFGKGELHFDVCSPWAASNSHKHETVKHTKARFEWGLVDDQELEKWTPRLRYKGTTLYMTQEARRWGIMGFIGRLIPKFRNAFRMLHYEFSR